MFYFVDFFIVLLFCTIHNEAIVSIWNVLHISGKLKFLVISIKTDYGNMILIIPQEILFFRFQCTLQAGLILGLHGRIAFKDENLEYSKVVLSETKKSVEKGSK